MKWKVVRQERCVDRKQPRPVTKGAGAGERGGEVRFSPLSRRNNGPTLRFVTEVFIREIICGEFNGSTPLDEGTLWD